MRLGPLDLSRVVPDVLTAASIRNDATRLDEPAREYVALAALGVSVAGPKDWPKPQPLESWTSYGSRVQGYLLLQSVPIQEALVAGWMAAQACSMACAIDDKRVEEMRDFFGVPRPSSTASDSEPDTKEAPSEG